MPIDTSPLLAMNTLWELLEAALEDVERVERVESYKINMDEHWHSPAYRCDSGRCELCAGGAVLAARCGASQSEYLRPWDFGIPERRRLYAIDSLRELSWENGVAGSPDSLWRVFAMRFLGDRKIRHTNWFATEKAAREHAEWISDGRGEVLSVSCYMRADLLLRDAVIELAERSGDAIALGVLPEADAHSLQMARAGVLSALNAEREAQS